MIVIVAVDVDVDFESGGPLLPAGPLVPPRRAAISLKRSSGVFKRGGFGKMLLCSPCVFPESVGKVCARNARRRCLFSGKKTVRVHNTNVFP